MNKLKKLELKKIVKEYSLIKTNDEYVSEIITVNTPDFLKQINDFMKESNISSESTQGTPNESNKPKSKNYNLAEFTESTKLKMKKIYREIVKITHPDKVEDPELNLIYIEAKDAYYHNDIMELFYLCDNLKIDVEVDDSDIVTFNRIIEDKRKRSGQVEKSYLWLWSTSNSEEEKLEIVKLFVEKTYGH
jgi:hypothetical protein